MAKKRKQLDQGKNKILLAVAAVAPLIFPLIFYSQMKENVGSGVKTMTILIYLFSHGVLIFAALTRFKSCPDCRSKFTKIEDGLANDYYFRCDKCGKEWDAPQSQKED